MIKLHTLVGILAIAASNSVAAAERTTAQHDAEQALSEWENTALYEPCINGDVSASGLYPSQIAEDKSYATLGVLAR